MINKRKKRRHRRMSHSHKGLISPQGKSYASGMATSPTALFNMYLHGAAVTSAIKIFFAILGIYSSVSNGDTSAIADYFLIAIDTYLPIFLTVDGGFVGWIDAIATFIFNLIFGLGWSTLKYDLATR